MRLLRSIRQYVGTGLRRRAGSVLTCLACLSVQGIVRRVVAGYQAVGLLRLAWLAWLSRLRRVLRGALILRHTLASANSASRLLSLLRA